MIEESLRDSNDHFVEYEYDNSRRYIQTRSDFESDEN